MELSEKELVQCTILDKILSIKRQLLDNQSNDTNTLENTLNRLISISERMSKDEL